MKTVKSENITVEQLAKALLEIKGIKNYQVESIGYRSDGCFSFKLITVDDKKPCDMYVNAKTGEIVE